MRTISNTKRNQRPAVARNQSTDPKVKVASIATDNADRWFNRFGADEKSVTSGASTPGKEAIRTDRRASLRLIARVENDFSASVCASKPDCRSCGFQLVGPFFGLAGTGIGKKVLDRFTAAGSIFSISAILSFASGSGQARM